MTDSDSSVGGDAHGSHCALCNEELSVEHADSILYHVLREHYDSKEFRDFIDAVVVPVRCRSCGEKFESSVRAHRSGSITAHTYCEDCREQSPLNEIMADRMSVREFVARGEMA